MKKILLIIISFIILSAHDMFLRMDSFFLDPNTSSTIHLYNGTFNESDNIITRDRMLDASIVHSGIRNLIDTSQWSELDSSITVLHFKTGEPGTYVAGVSTRARDIELEAKSFNEYLEHDGVLDILDQRKKDGTMDQSAIEKYSKHVKIIFQVGEERSEDWKTVLDYPIEFVPLTNPYDLEKGDYMEMQLLRNGIPLSNQLVYGGFSDGGHSHTHGGDHEPHHHDEKSMRTDAKGMFKFKLDHGGKWYVRTIHMVLSEEPGLTHESNWATLTFEVEGIGHGSNSNMLFWSLGILLLIGVFVYLLKRLKN